MPPSFPQRASSKVDSIVFVLCVMLGVAIGVGVGIHIGSVQQAHRYCIALGGIPAGRACVATTVAQPLLLST